MDTLMLYYEQTVGRSYVVQSRQRQQGKHVSPTTWSPTRWLLGTAEPVATISPAHSCPVRE